MGFKEIVQRMGERQRAKKEHLNAIQEKMRFYQIAEDRLKSSNERELERFQKEEREENIKQSLEYHRKKREHDIRFNHNPLDAPNITKGTQWNVLKERNQFTNNGNMFTNQKSVLRNDNRILKGNKKLLNGKRLFKI